MGLWRGEERIAASFRGIWLAALVLSLWLGGCSSEPEHGKPATDVADVAAEDVAHPQPDAQTDVGADLGVQPDVHTCPEEVVCADNERVVNCRCVRNIDRICTRDSECRETETCTDFETYKVCMFEPGPVRTCPGSAGCEDEGDGVLYVGAASKIITPVGFETPTAEGLDGVTINFAPPMPEGKWNDCGLDGLCPGDEGYPGPDEGEGDGVMQGMWLAGFSHGRPAQYCPEERIGCDAPECCVSKFAHDDLMSQIVVFRQNNTTVAFVVIDVVGYFHTDIERIRQALPESLGIDLLVMASTHNHQAPDTAGQWGPGTVAAAESGRSPAFIQRIKDQTVAGITEAVAALEPANVRAMVIQAGVEGMAIADSRPPYIFDDNLPVVHITSRDTGQTIATMVSFGNHAEVLWAGNTLITSDYPHFVRKYIGEGLEAVVDAEGNELKPALPGLGGVTAFYASAVGGLINPGRGGAKDYAGNAFDDDLRHTFAAADAVGQTIASHVLAAAANDELELLEDTRLAFATKEYLSPIINVLFRLAAFQAGLLERDIYNSTPETVFRYKPGPPMLMSAVSVVRLGPLTFFTAPGEVFPETLVGGYPGRHSVWDPVIGDVEGHMTPPTCDEDGLPTPENDGTHPCIVRPNQTNPPDWSAAPEGPYVYERVPGEIPFFIGLGMDFLGYMVPEYDFEEVGYLSQAPGSHYEETNGIGPDSLVHWETHLDMVIEALE